MRLLLLAAAVLFAHCVTAFAAGAQRKGVSVLGADPTGALNLSGADAAGATIEKVAVTGQGFTSALLFRNTKRPQTPYTTQLTLSTTTAVSKGDVLHAMFWVKCVEAAEQGEVQTEFVFEKGGDPWTKSTVYMAHAGSSWKRFDWPFTVKEDYAAGGAHICFRLGYNPQTLMLGGLQLLNHGTSVKKSDLPRTPATYPGQAEDAAWRAAARERIERIRKADLSVTVEDASGKPVPNADVEVWMTRHEFGFGTAVNASYLFDGNEDENKRRYRAEIKRLFNKTVLENALKWPSWRGVWGSGGREKALKTIAWLREQGIDVRGHCCVWPSWKHTSEKLSRLKDDKDKLRSVLREHVLDICRANAGTLVEWDVINEPYSNHDLMDVLGKDVMVDWFKFAREAAPNAKLYINDYAILAGGGSWSGHKQHYEDTIELLVEKGAPLDGIGLQSHFGSGATAPARLVEILDRFAKFGKTLQVTEFDINSEDEKFQADYTRDFMTALFSHPAVNGIIMWGFWDGRHWHKNAPVFREDWSMKPSGEVWIEHVFAKWWTTANLRTDASGGCSVRGYRGEYEIMVKSGRNVVTKKVTLGEGGASVRVALP